MNRILQIVNARMGRVRRETLNGRNYLVAPFVSLVEGVLVGSRGALFYSAAEISKNPGIWNSIPLTLGHPSDPATGQPQSARDPEVLNRVQLGNVYKDQVTNDGRRVGEAWFDETLTRERAPDIHNKLEQAAKGRNVPPVELSTGLLTDNVPAQNGATYNGREFTHHATEMKPDHLAILSNQIGACSAKDGCGVIMNAPQPKRPQVNRATEIKPQPVYGFGPGACHERVDNCDDDILPLLSWNHVTNKIDYATGSHSFDDTATVVEDFVGKRIVEFDDPMVMSIPRFEDRKEIEAEYVRENFRRLGIRNNYLGDDPYIEPALTLPWTG